MAKEPDFVDGFTALPNGIDSLTTPQLLPQQTAAFATNATFRGQFITNRPGLRKINLEFQTPIPPAPPSPPEPPFIIVTKHTVTLRQDFDPLLVEPAGQAFYFGKIFSIVSSDLTFQAVGDADGNNGAAYVNQTPGPGYITPSGSSIQLQLEFPLPGVLSETVFLTLQNSYFDQAAFNNTPLGGFRTFTGNVNKFRGLATVLTGGNLLTVTPEFQAAFPNLISNVVIKAGDVLTTNQSADNFAFDSAASFVPPGFGNQVTFEINEIVHPAETLIGQQVYTYGPGTGLKIQSSYTVISASTFQQKIFLPPIPPTPPGPPTPPISDLVNNLFQGTCYYKPLFGSESLMAAIGGHLFQFIIGPGTVSAGVQEGQLFLAFVAPAINDQVTIQINSIYPFQIGQLLYILNAAVPANQGDPNRFEITSISGNSNVRSFTVINRGTAQGTVYTPGAFVSVFATIDDGSAFIVDRSIPGDLNSPSNPVNWLWQSERWVIDNDGQSLPIFFDGVTSRRSVGNNLELPVGKMGAYVFGRNWVALPDGVTYMAGDIVGGSSGTLQFNFKDAVLKAVENSYLAGGGSFSIPGNTGIITAMASAITLDAALGQGPIQIFTEFGAFSCNAPVDRSVWQSVTNPLQTQSLIGGGALGQDGVTSCNGDLIFRSANPTNGFRSLILGRRDFNSWGNTSQSTEVQRVLDQDNKALLPYVSEIQFDNRMIGTCLPTNGPLGVYHQGLVCVNFDPVSSLRGKGASIWDGFWTGLNVFKLVTGTFLGVQRAFAFVFNEATTKLELYELLPTTSDNNFDNGSIPIPWSVESASLFLNVKGKGPFDLIEIQDGEIHLGDVSGTVQVTAYFKADFSQCWFQWKSFTICSDPTLPKSSRSRLGLGQPDEKLCDLNSGRPARIARNFQVRLAITGTCKVFGMTVKAVPAPEQKYAEQVCDGAVIVCTQNDPCLQFPLVSYSLNAGKHYTNDDLNILVTCPDGTTQTIFIQAGTVNFTLPWAFGFTGPFPPITLGCQADVIPPAPAPPSTVSTIQLEDGTDLLLEDGTPFLME